MKALIYLFFTNLKNKIKDLRHHPATLILYLFITAMLIFVIFSGSTEYHDTKTRDLSELAAGCTALYAVMFLMILMNGLSSGASFFSMADVNIMFQTPIPTKRILFYGLLKQLGTSLMLGFFIIFQYGWLGHTYNLGIGGLFMILLGYGFTVFCAQLTSMVVYSFISGDDRRHKIIKYTIYAITAAVAIYLIIPVLTTSGDRIAALVSAANTIFARLYPVGGWLGASIGSYITGNYFAIPYGFITAIVYCAVLIFALTRIHSDFYEDVLKATEVSFTAITAKKEGKVGEAIPANVKVGHEGIGKGHGSAAFFHKHMLENRRSKLYVIDTISLVFAVITVVFAFVLREEGIMPIFIFATYMQIFGVANGRWLRELLLPYIYLLPENPFTKLINLCRENLVKVSAEALVVFLPVGLILGLSVPEIAAVIIARIGYGILFMAGNILCERLLGSICSKGILMMFYFIIILVLAVPGIIIASVIIIAMNGTVMASVLAFLATALWNSAISTLIIFLCKNILDFAELNNK